MAKNRLDYEAHLSRHSHDISAGYTASIAPGMIIPQYFHILGPGDSIYYSSHMFARLQDVVTAFLGEIDIHIDSFFVPLQMLYTPFGQVFAQTDDFISSNFAVNTFASQDSFPLLEVTDSIEVNAPSQQTSFGDECWGKQCFRLLDALDLNPLGVCSAVQQAAESYQDPAALDDSVTYNPNIAPWIPAAYQCIYQKYYRNDELERLSVSKYNFDNHYGGSSFVDSDYFTVRYVQRPRDYFTDARVSPISSSVNTFASQITFPSNGGTPSALIQKVDSFLTSGGVSYPFSVGSQKVSSPIGITAPSAFENVTSYAQEQKGAANPQLLDAANIRALFAVDKFSRIYGRADKTYDDQILAHFGIKIPHDVKHDITHLKHFRAVLQADPVYATANVQTAQQSTITTLGQVGGQGQVDFNSQEDKFTAPVHGVFMIVAYVVTKPRYVGTFNKLHLANNRLSFPIPEFDKLGAQPLYAFEVHPAYFQKVSGLSPHVNCRIGWQNRYAQYKQKYNRASWLYYSGQYGHGSVSANSYGPWVISKLPFTDSLDVVGGTPSIPGGSSASSAFVTAEWFFERADSLDCVMHRQFEPAWSDSYFNQPHLMLQSDPILTEFMCRAKLVSWMSETGEPDL